MPEVRPLSCRLGLHKWSSWGYYSRNGRKHTHCLSRECFRCGKEDIR